MKRLKALAFFAILFFATTIAKAGGGDPEWKLSIGDAINSAKWMKQSETGILLLGTSGGLVGIDPDKHAIIWKQGGKLDAAINMFSDVPESQVEDITGTPFLMINKTDATGMFAQVIILNVLTGVEVFSSKSEKIRVEEKYPMYALNGLLLEYVKEKKKSLCFIDFATGTNRWTIDIGEGKSTAGSIFNKVSGLGALSSLSGKTKFTKADSDGNILFIDGKNLSRIDGQNGSILWKKTFSRNISRVFEEKSTKVVYFGVKGEDDLYAINLKDGEDLWKKPMKLDGAFNRMVPYSDNELLVLHERGFNIFNLQTNSFLWKKDAKVGNVNDIRITDEGFIAADVDEKGARFIFVNKEGKDKWDFKVSEPLLTFSITSKGMLYITEDRANIVDIPTGKDLWKRDMKLKGMPAFAINKAQNEVALFSKKTLYSISLNTGEYRTIKDDVDFKDMSSDDKNNIRVEFVNDNYLVYSAQNYMLIAPDGKEAYYTNFPRVGSTAARIAAGFGSGVLGVAGGLAQMQVSGDGGKTYQSAFNENVQTAGAGMDAGSSALGGLSKRKSASKTTKNNAYVLTKFDDGTKGLACMSKASGKEVSRMIFKDNTPVYVVDEMTGRLFLLTGNEIDCFNLEGIN